MRPHPLHPSTYATADIPVFAEKKNFFPLLFHVGNSKSASSVLCSVNQVEQLAYGSGNKQ